MEIEDLQRRVSKLTADGDNLRIDLSARDTEVENLKFRIAGLRDEREALRQDVKLQTTRAKDAEARLAQEEHRVLRLEDKLAREVASRTDKEAALERRMQEIARLKQKLKAVTIDAKASLRSGTTGAKVSAARKTEAATSNSAPLTDEPPHPGVDIAAVIAASPQLSEMADTAHNRATALSERLLKARTDDNDDALRQELASIAASMIALTARAEGSASPLYPILEQSGQGSSGDRENLAARARTLLSAGEPASAS
jgi:chromosome segregation ATPase